MEFILQRGQGGISGSIYKPQLHVLWIKEHLSDNLWEDRCVHKHGKAVGLQPQQRQYTDAADAPGKEKEVIHYKELW